MNTARTAKSRYAVRVGPRGRLVLPAAVREQLGVAPGDEVIMSLDPPRGVRLTSRAEVARRCAGMLQPPPGRDLVAELLDERRTEAEQEP